MILLKNIQIEGSVIKSDIYPEDCSDVGKIVVDAKTGEIKEYYLPVGYEWCKRHLLHAKRELIAIAKLHDIPEKKMIMWY